MYKAEGREECFRGTVCSVSVIFVRYVRMSGEPCER